MSDPSHKPPDALVGLFPDAERALADFDDGRFVFVPYRYSSYGEWCGEACISRAYVEGRFDEAIQRFTTRPDPFYRLDAAIFDRQNWLEIECRTEEARRAANTTAAVQELKRIDRQINANVIAGFVCQRFALRQGGSFGGCSGCGEDHESHRHRGCI